MIVYTETNRSSMPRVALRETCGRGTGCAVLLVPATWNRVAAHLRERSQSTPAARLRAEPG